MTLSSKGTLNVLLVEDNPGDAELFKLHLNTSGDSEFPPAAVTHVEALEPALEELTRDTYDLVLLDLGLPGSSGLATLERYLDATDTREALDPTPVVVLTGLEDETVSLAAIERGAQDYLMKDELNRRTLNRTIRYALERHKHQQELRRQNQHLEEFAHVVSHDLRNPLNLASGRLRALKQNCDNEHIEVIEDAHDRMQQLIDDLLTLARQGQTVKETKQLNLSELSRDAWNIVPTDAAELVCKEEITIEADHGRCKQLLENLFRNAVEHGGEDVTVRLGPLPDGFFIEDDGPGVPEPIRDDVFDAGFTTNEDGTGFGLNIVEVIAEAHGWTVEITNGTDGGTRFEFTEVSEEMVN